MIVAAATPATPAEMTTLLPAAANTVAAPAPTMSTPGPAAPGVKAAAVSVLLFRLFVLFFFECPRVAAAGIGNTGGIAQRREIDGDRMFARVIERDDGASGMTRPTGGRGCGDTHHREVGAPRCVGFAGRCSPSMYGNESSPSAAPPSPTSRRRKARSSALMVAA
jgi:hypothetical protein